MKTWKKISLVTALVVTMGFGTSAVLARGGHCDGYGDGRGCQGMAAWTPEQVQERAQLRLARLELALAIKPEQKEAWEQFSRAAKVRAEKMAQQMSEMQKAGQPKTALERLGRMEKMAQNHLNMLTEMRPNVETLYGVLSDAQKRVFDAEWAQRVPGAGFAHHGGMGDGNGRGGRGKGAGSGNGMM